MTSSAPHRPRVALLGAGRIGAHHGRRLARCEAGRLSLVIDGTEANARSLAERLDASWGTDPAEALEDPAIDALVIATPTPTHAALAEACARAGKPFLVEKPLAHDLESGARVVRAVEARGVPAQVGFQRRFDPAMAEARRRLDAGELGRVEGFRGVGRDPQPPALAYLRSAGGLFVDMGIHDLDSARFLVGEVRRVWAVGGAVALPELAREGLHDTAVATLEFANGAVGTVEVALRTAYGYDVRVEVLGERGRYHVEVDRRPDLLAYDGRGGSFDRPRDFEQRFDAAFRLQFETFLRAVADGARLTPDPRDAWHSLRLALATQRSLDTGEPVTVASLAPAPGAGGAEAVEDSA